MPEAVVHPRYVRIMHWINALATLIMVSSGWQIYNASPLFAFTFPGSVALGGWLAGGLLWHFAAMWLLVANGLVYLIVGLATGRLRRKLLPIRCREVVRDFGAALTGRRSPRLAVARSVTCSTSIWRVLLQHAPRPDAARPPAAGRRPILVR
jgi:thiosulfate reductase cytochrome b subunit